jgi:hypothetical protein
MFVLFFAAGPPVSGQTDQHTRAFAVAIEHALADRGMGGDARAGILLDTVRSAIDSHVALQLAQELASEHAGTMACLDSMLLGAALSSWVASR